MTDQRVPGGRTASQELDQTGLGRIRDHVTDQRCPERIIGCHVTEQGCPEGRIGGHVTNQGYPEGRIGGHVMYQEHPEGRTGGQVTDQGYPEGRIGGHVMDHACPGRIGDYVFEETEVNKLGEGAFGKVYRAEHIHSGIPVAVKKLDKEKIKYDELQAVRKLNNDHVIGIIDLCHSNHQQDYVFIVLELCDSDLKNHLKHQQDGRLNQTDLQCIIVSLARGYLALYEKCIIHRDIKPENILLKYSNAGGIMSAKFGDFGSSRLIDEQNSGGRVLNALAGTPLYMAPEIGANILGDRSYDAKVDSWSMGVVLYECITGQIPFDESALCRLFLFSANKNYHGYKGPPYGCWPSSMPLCYQVLINRLLELNVDQRLSPVEFHCLVVHQDILTDALDQSMITSLPPDQYDLKTRKIRGGCCSGIRSQRYVDENENSTKEVCEGKCSNCNNRRVMGKKRPARPHSKISYILQRCAWFTGMFVACNYCCFTMRQYAYET